MAQSPEELIARWRARPDAASTLALTDALRLSGRTEMARTVAEFVQKNLAGEVGVLTAAARMCIAHSLLPDAQQLLVTASALAPKSGILHRLHGEVLLRRGDAERAGKVLERGARIDPDPEIRKWLERAQLCRPLQVRDGAKAVADEIAAKYPLTEGDRRARAPNGPDSDDEIVTDVRSAKDDRRRSERPLDDDIDTHVRSAKDDIRPAIDAIHARRAALPEPARASSERPPSAPPLRAPPPAPPAPAFRPPSAPPAPRPPSAPPAPRPPSAPPAPRPPSAPPAPRPPAPPAPEPLGVDIPTGGDSTRVPDARGVLDELAGAGIFEPDAGDRGPARLEWATPEAGPPQRRRYVVAGLLVASIVGATIGEYFYANDRRAKDHAAAEALLAKVDSDLRAGSAADEPSLARAFELEPLSPHAALTWLHERAVSGLVRGADHGALAAPLSRARRAGVPERDLAFASLAAALFGGDTLGAVRVLPEWDERSGKDAHYQLFAGIALERAGDPHAESRFVAATRLDPAMVLAEAALARHVAIGGDPQKAKALAKLFQSKYATRADANALVALAWARDPARASPPPREVKETLDHEADLPRSLAFLPFVLRTLEALPSPASPASPASPTSPDRARDWDTIARGLERSYGPAEACWLGELALEVGGEGAERMARRAALLAATFSPAHPGARTLAARVALMSDRLEEAREATGGLDPAAPIVGLVRALVAYEALDTDGLAKALDALSLRKAPVPKGPPPKGAKGAKPEPPPPPVFAAQTVLVGAKLPLGPELLALAKTGEPWADVLAMDSALDAGDLATADRLAERFERAGERPSHALRLARLARYRGKLDEADRWSRVALDGSPTARAVIERLFVVVARKEHKAVEPLLTRHGAVLGALSKWASAYALAASGKVEPARAKLAHEEEPQASAPVLARLLAGATYGSMRERNAGYKYIQSLVKAGLTNPDVASAAENVHLPPVKTRSE